MIRHVAVLIVGYRNPDDIETCLAALSNQTWTDFEVVICENGGSAAFEQLKRRTSARLAGGQATRVLDAGRNLGFAGGVNLAMAACADADAWWLLNPDTAPEPETLAALAARLAAGDCEAVGGVLCGQDGRIQSVGGLWRAWLARAVSLGLGHVSEEVPDQAWVERRQNYLSGASMLVSRAFVASAGQMREDYFLYCEEVEWCLRARRSGVRLGYAPDARVRHARGSTTGAREAKAKQPRLPIYLNERNRILLTRDLFPRRLLVASAAALAVAALRYGRRGAWRQFCWAIAGWGAGVAGRRGPPSWSET